MYRKILVPLDGSELAECVLPHVKNMVKDGLTGEAILLNVFYPYFPMPEEKDLFTYGDYNATKKRIRQSSINYLANLQCQLDSEGVKVKTEILTGFSISTMTCSFRKSIFQRLLDSLGIKFIDIFLNHSTGGKPGGIAFHRRLHYLDPVSGHTVFSLLIIQR